MSFYSSPEVYPPEADGMPLSETDFYDLGEEVGDDPNELSPFELQYLNEYSSRDIEESLFYEKGVPV